MNILAITNKDIVEKLYILNDFMYANWNIRYESENDKILQIIKYNKIDMIIIQSRIENYQSILRSIVMNRPKIKIITISDELICNEKNTCESCSSKYDRKRLLEPFNIRELYETIVNFNNIQCRYYKSSYDIDGIITRIVEKFSGYEYIRSTRLIILKNNYKDSMYEMIEIIKLLKQYNISYDFKHDNSISIV